MRRREITVVGFDFTGGNSKILAKIGNSVVEPLLKSVRTGGKARILTKIAHSIVKPLLKRLHEVGKNERNGNKCCMNYIKYTLERLLLGLKRSKPGTL